MLPPLVVESLPVLHPPIRPPTSYVVLALVGVGDMLLTIRLYQVASDDHVTFVQAGGPLGLAVTDFPHCFPICLRQVLAMEPMSPTQIVNLGAAQSSLRFRVLDSGIEELQSIAEVVQARYRECQEYHMHSLVHFVGPRWFPPSIDNPGLQVQVEVSLDRLIDPPADSVVEAWSSVD